MGIYVNWCKTVGDQACLWSNIARFTYKGCHERPPDNAWWSWARRTHRVNAIFIVGCGFAVHAHGRWGNWRPWVQPIASGYWRQSRCTRVGLRICWDHFRRAVPYRRTASSKQWRQAMYFVQFMRLLACRRRLRSRRRRIVPKNLQLFWVQQKIILYLLQRNIAQKRKVIAWPLRTNADRWRRHYPAFGDSRFFALHDVGRWRYCRRGNWSVASCHRWVWKSASGCHEICAHRQNEPVLYWRQ